MIGIIECVEQVLVERMDILKTRKRVEDEGELLTARLLREFDFSSIKIANS